jgi:type IV pilus assembly protein PilQ
MNSLRTLAAATLVAIGTIGTSAAEARARAPFGEGTVTSLRVEPTTGRADVAIGVDGKITLKHFTLTKPDKIVVDISNATLGLPAGESYDGIARGGITNIRYSQFSRSVVRVVLTLDGAREYTVSHQSGAIHISVSAPDQEFQRWSLRGSEAPLAEVAPREQSAPIATTPAVTTPAVTTSAVTRPAATTPAATTPAATTPGVMAPEVTRPETTKPDAVIAVLPHRVFARSETSPAPASKTARQQQQAQARITVSWEDAPIADVLAMFANWTNRTILPSRAVSGKVSANIVDKPWDVALKAVLNANGFDVTEDGNNIIIVDTYEHIAERRATIPLNTRHFRLNYARATSVAPMVANLLTRACPASSPQTTAGSQQTPMVGAPVTLSCPPRGAVTADSLTNSISITDIPSALPDLERYARGLDLRQPQVNIRAKIVLVDRSTLEALGLRYDIGTPQQFFNDIVPRLDSTGRARVDAGQILLGGNTISAIANASQRIPAAALQLVYSTAMGNFDFTTFLEALQTTSLLDVQAEPSATVLNNRTANLTAGTQVPIRIIDAGSGGNATGNFPRATVNFQQTGVILQVIPQITNNRQVQMKVHVENSDVQFQSNDVGAVFPKQSVDNEMLVADGETAVMGGLTQTTVRMTKSGIPILVDLPIIGRLFGVTNRQETKRDLLILITPHIIDDGQAEPPAGRP